ncbi:hypothetical protein QBC34DRAFT_487752 [Podospora aff. communis PSN243]|uniref:Protein kinase domain-containing protein n=1 Tax=Podospora aff. communis PSN243 TaxID=3040156 RepID=A0AAV9G866_9PEZI|nr:hypothetical protein QBC34DRAFT_487752 [Podospora aff. communis PSN243]
MLQAVFISHNITDDSLPLRYRPPSWPDGRFFHDFFKDFMPHQWQFFPLPFHRDVFDDRQIGDECILPISSPKIVAQGITTIERVDIDTELNLLLPQQHGNRRPIKNTFVFKLYMGKIYEHAFKKHLQALLRVQKPPSPNIIEFYGSFRQLGNYCLVLEHADGGNLEEFFSCQPAPTTAEDVRQFWMSLLHVFAGLDRIHGLLQYGEDGDDITSSIHLGIAPENILLVLGPSGSPYDFTPKIANFGIYDVGWKFSIDFLTGATKMSNPTFSAPELLRLGQKTRAIVRPPLTRVTTSADIFSMGAVLSHTAAWVTGNHDEQSAYFQTRKMYHASRVPRFVGSEYEGCFHDSQNVLPVVAEQHLKCRKNCLPSDDVTPKVLDLVEQYMLVESPKNRWRARDILERMEKDWMSQTPPQSTAPPQHRTASPAPTEADTRGVHSGPDTTLTSSSRLTRSLSSSGSAHDPTVTSVTNRDTIASSATQGKVADFADAASVYTSDVPDSARYMEELATSLFQDSLVPDAQSLERILAILPELLWALALKVGAEEGATVDHFEAMKFIQQKRRKIAEHFEEYYLRDKTDTDPKLRDTSSCPSPTQKVQEWNLNEAISNAMGGIEDPSSLAMDPRPTLEASFQDADRDTSSEDENVEDEFQPSKYRDLVRNSSAFQWALHRVRLEVGFGVSDASVMEDIATRIRTAFYSQRENCIVSSKRGPPRCSMLFRSDWDPLAFYHEQQYTGPPGDALEGAIVISQCGIDGDAEAMSFVDYLSRTWPMLGPNLMSLVKHVTQGERGSVFSVKDGVVETIVEVGQLYGWMITALHAAPGDVIASASPTIDITSNENPDPEYTGTFRLKHDTSSPCSSGQCWQNLFRNPLVVSGYPVRRRPLGQKPGLEISLGMLAAMLGTRQLGVFNGKIFLHGFCTMLVPTMYDEGIVHWHVLFNEDGKRMSFLDGRVSAAVQGFDLSKHLLPSAIEDTRHIVGWCRHSRNYVGKYTHLVIPIVLFHCGKKDKPARAAKASDYHKQLEWAEDKFVVLYDCEERRAWLVDGLSVLLHLVLARVAHRRRKGRIVLFGEDDIQGPNTPYIGKAAAKQVLYNTANMSLKVYERWNRVVEETSKKGKEPAEVNEKTQKTWEQLPDLVADVYNMLAILFDIQTDELTADGLGARIRKSPRRNLEGWDFQHIAAGTDPLWPKVAFLRDIGLGWVDLARGIRAITLFGVGFGNVVQPEGQTKFARWSALPTGKDLLATTTPVIQDIMHSVYRNPSNNGDRFWELFPDIYWHSPDKVFEECSCEETTPDGNVCDRVQVLLPTKFPSLFTRRFRSPPQPFPEHGALVFGHSLKFPLAWKWEPSSLPTECRQSTFGWASLSSSRIGSSSTGTSASSLSGRQPDNGEGGSSVSSAHDMDSAVLVGYL